MCVCVGGCVCLPGAHGEPHGGADVPATTDVDISRKQRGEVCAGRDRVRGNVGPELRQGKRCRNHKDAKSCRSVRLVQESAEQIQRVPDRVAVDDR